LLACGCTDGKLYSISLQAQFPSNTTMSLLVSWYVTKNLGG
jgi:hypothetical protein